MESIDLLKPSISQSRGQNEITFLFDKVRETFMIAPFSRVSC